MSIKGKILIKEAIHLIANKRVCQIIIYQLEALLRCLAPVDGRREDIEAQLKRRILGYQGEKRFDYFLKLLPQEKFYILNNLRFEHYDTAFEIDTILLSPYFNLLNDVKNYKGILYFDLLLKQCTRTYNHLKESITDPITQSLRHHYQIKSLWKETQLPVLPIRNLVIISHPTTMIQTNPGLEQKLNHKVIHADYFIERVEEISKEYPKRRFSDKQLETTVQFLLDQHRPKTYNLIEKYGLVEKDFLKGVRCSVHSTTKMNWVRGKWHCPLCQMTSETAHQQRIHDYLLVQKPSITNAECRKLLELDSEQIVKRLLNNMNLDRSGTTKNTLYSLPKDLSFLRNKVKSPNERINLASQ